LLIVGKETNCCMTFSDHGERCLTDSVEKRNSGLYLLLQHKDNVSPTNGKNFVNLKLGVKIVGSSYAWRSRSGNITFDSWESKDSEKLKFDGIAEKLIEQFCKQIDDQSISRITSGASPRTPAWFKRDRASVCEWMREGHWYPDSFVQYVLFESKALEDERKNLKSEIFDEFPIHYVTSVQQARTLISNKAKIMQWKDVDKLEILLKIQANEENISLEELETFYPLLNNENIARFYDVDVNCTVANRYTNWKEVLDCDLNVLHVITSENARELYEECIVTFQFLKEINISSKKLNALIYQGVEPYKKGILKFETMASIETPEKIRSLIGGEALNLYQYAILKLEDLLSITNFNSYFFIGISICSQRL